MCSDVNFNWKDLHVGFDASWADHSITVLLGPVALRICSKLARRGLKFAFDDRAWSDVASP